MANFVYILSFLTAIIEGMAFGGISLGWPSLSYILQLEGYFSSECNISNISYTQLNVTGCIAQKESLVLVSAVGQFSFSFGMLIAGTVLDIIGSLVTRSFGTILFTIGCLIIVYISPDYSEYLFLSISLISIGGVCLHLSNIKVANLFPSRKGLVITWIECSIDVSALTFPFIKLAYSDGISLKTSFTIMCVLTIYQWMRTFFLMPIKHIPESAPENGYTLGSVLQLTKKHNDDDDDGDEKRPLLSDHQPPNSEIPLSSSLTNIHFLLNIMFLCILAFRSNFFNSTLNNWLEDGIKGSTITENSFLISMFGYFAVTPLFTSPILGLCTDFCLKRFSIAKAIAVPLFLTSVIMLIFSVLACFCLVWAPLIYITFVFFHVSQGFTWASYSIFLALYFPENHFGRLSGITCTVAAVLYLLQYPLSMLVFEVFNGSFLPVNVFFIFLCSLTLLHPAMLYYKTN